MPRVSSTKRHCLGSNGLNFPIKLPIEYSPDLNDHKLRKEIRSTMSDNDIHIIGQGSQAIVIAAVKDIGNGHFASVALKRLDVAKITKENESLGYTFMLREVQMNSFLSHPNITKMLDVFYENDEAGQLRYLWLACERMECTLQYYFSRLNNRDVTHSKYYRDHAVLSCILVQILQALKFLHERGIMHRDINPKNIGMNSSPLAIKLLDFGVAGYTDDYCTQVVGTPLAYRAPELLRKPLIFDTKIDIFSLAVLSLEMLNFKLMLPLDDQHKYNIETALQRRCLQLYGKEMPYELYKNFEQTKCSTPGTMIAEIKEALNCLNARTQKSEMTNDNLLKLLISMLSFDPRDRPTAADCLSFKYLIGSASTYCGKVSNVNERNATDKANLMFVLERQSREI